MDRFRRAPCLLLSLSTVFFLLRWSKGGEGRGATGGSYHISKLVSASKLAGSGSTSWTIDLDLMRSRQVRFSCFLFFSGCLDVRGVVVVIIRR